MGERAARAGRVVMEKRNKAGETGSAEFDDDDYFVSFPGT